MTGRAIRTLLVGCIVWAFFVYAGGRAVDVEHARAGMTSETVPVRYEGKTAAYWARWGRQQQKNSEARGRTIRRLKRELARRHAPSSLAAISLASTAYRVDHTMLVRKARCETGGTFSPYAKNPRSTASGLFQFLTSTWATTPYARFSIWDPYANALAAGWMHDVGRGREWACR